MQQRVDDLASKAGAGVVGVGDAGELVDVGDLPTAVIVVPVLGVAASVGLGDHQAVVVVLVIARVGEGIGFRNEQETIILAVGGVIERVGDRDDISVVIVTGSRRCG